jgi:hypothetical protein
MYAVTKGGDGLKPRHRRARRYPPAKPSGSVESGEKLSTSRGSTVSTVIRLPTCHNRITFTGSNTKWSSQTGINPSATPYARNATLLATATIRRCNISFMQKAVITKPAARKPTALQAFIS